MRERERERERDSIIVCFQMEEYEAVVVVRVTGYPQHLAETKMATPTFEPNFT